MGVALAPWSSRQARRYALLLLLAWLPTLTFVGHWEGLVAPFTSAGMATAAHVHSPASDREHAQHCHSGFDECGGGASAVTTPAGAPIHAVASGPEGSATDLVLFDEHPPRGFAATPPTPPPQATA